MQDTFEEQKYKYVRQIRQEICKTGQTGKTRQQICKTGQTGKTSKISKTFKIKDK